MLSSTMRVGLISYDFFPPEGGQGVYVYEIFKRLPDHGVTMVVFSSAQNDLEGSVYIPAANPLSFSFLANLKLGSWMQKYKLDLLHIQGGPGGVLLLRRPKIPVVYTAHHLYQQQSAALGNSAFRGLAYALLKAAEKRGYALSRYLIAVSSTTRNSLVEHYAIPPPRIRVIPNGVDLEVFRPLGLERIPQSILFVGRLHPRKGLPHLLEAVARVRETLPEIQLFLIGEGAMKEKQEALIQRYHLQNSIHFLGRVSQKELVEWYNRCQLFVLPSLLEGFGIVCIEAMACGTPVIGTQVAGIVDVIDRETGILVPPGDSDSLAKAIGQILSDEALRQAIAQKARARVMERFRWDGVVERIVGVYREVLQST